MINRAKLACLLTSVLSRLSCFQVFKLISLASETAYFRPFPSYWWSFRFGQAEHYT